MAAAAVALGAAGSAGCSSDIFDVSFELGAQQYPVDFGSQSGTIPAVACQTEDISVCGSNQVLQLMGDMGEAQIIVGCDAAVARCFAQAKAKLTYTVDVLQDEAFVSKVGRRAVSIVRMLDIAYTIPVNTTTFDIPGVGVYVGPPGSKIETDFGVQLVDTMPALAAGTVVAAGSPRHLVVADGSPARDLMERSIRGKTPFVVIVALSPRVQSGSPMPAGKLEIDVVPLLGLGLR